MKNHKQKTKNGKTVYCNSGTNLNTSNTDPLGSYTGKPAFGEKPEQDADDL